jgi:hypothetical protein
MDNNPLLNFNLEWPAKIRKKIEKKGNIALLEYANIIKDDFSKSIMDSDSLSGYGTVMVPIGHDGNSAVCEWITDISEVQYESLTKMVQSVFKDIEISPSKQCWYWKKYWVQSDLSDDYKIDASIGIAKELQELEMMLYAHPVNQSRSKYQQSKISGFMLGKIGSKRWTKKYKIVGDSALIGMMKEQTSLQAWLEEPFVNCVLVVGSEAGDQDWFRIKETVLHLMESRHCDLVEVIQSSSHDIYSASWFYKVYSQWKDYLFSKQAI